MLALLPHHCCIVVVSLLCALSAVLIRNAWNILEKKSNIESSKEIGSLPRRLSVTGPPPRRARAPAQRSGDLRGLRIVRLAIKHMTQAGWLFVEDDPAETQQQNMNSLTLL